LLRLVDSHAHLDELPDLARSLREARDSGVVAVVAVGCDPESNERALEIAREYEGYVFPAAGLHPWDYDEGTAEEGLRYLERRAGEFVAIGEVGLDYRIGLDRGLQRRVFARVLEVARRLRKPVIVHARDAWGDAVRAVLESGVEVAVFHWYSGPLELLDEIVEAGHYISATPAATYQERHRRALREAPLDRILLESDCPVVYRGLESRPAHVALAARGVADVKGLPVSEVAEAGLRNSIKALGLQVRT